MLFLTNPATKKKRKRTVGARPAKKRRARGKLQGAAKAAFLRRMAAGRRKRRAVVRTRTATGGTVAKRRRRRAVVRRAAPRRRRRRAVALAVNPRRRRRRVVRHHRRRLHRNPGMGSVVGTIKQGVKDGALVLIGQTAQGRASALAAKFNPISGIAGTAINEIGSAVLVTMAARKFAPGLARMASAGAFSNAVRRLVATVSPGTAALLGDGSAGYYTPAPYGYDMLEQGHMGAYPQMGAYPGGGLGDQAGDEHMVYS